MKRLLFIFIVIIVSINAFTACGGRNNSEKIENSASPAAPETPKQSNSSTDNNPIGKETIRFIVMADSRGLDNGINLESITKTMESIKKLQPQPEFAVMPGDLVEGGNVKEELQHFKDTITKYYPISFFYPGFGNHEATTGENGEKAFEEVFSEFNANFLEGYHKTVYYFDKGGSRFYMLNSNHPGESEIISDKQLDWISTNTIPNIKHALYFFHEPAFPTGAHVGSSLDVNKLQRDKFWKLIDCSKTPIAFCGHEHNYTRRHINSDFNERVDNENFSFKNNIFQVTTGTFGAPVYSGYRDQRDVDVPPVLEYHYAVVDIADTKIQVTVYNLDGKVLDSFSQ